ncbi:hypothetical protein [Bacillus sp. Brlt_9]|uniref:hypothetical protein n=1 Tax=Bacillus sp. Brlt_9 TaxID=3110916 RepID=UPI003F7B4733
MTNQKEKIVAIIPQKCKRVFEEFVEKYTGIQYRKFHLEGIRNPLAFIAGAWCLKRIGKKLPLGFNLGDIDGFVCYYDRFIFVEFKKDTEALNKWQLAAYLQLTEQTKGTVFIVFGENCSPTSYLRIDQNHPYGSDVYPTNLDNFQNILDTCCTLTGVDYFDDHSKKQWFEKIIKADSLIKKADKQFKDLMDTRSLFEKVK